MQAGPATLDIYIQRRPDVGEYSQTYIDEHFPLDRGTVTWDERTAAPVKVATISLPSQVITEPEQAIYGDWLAFNIGRVPQANAPVGSIAEARMSVYQASADYRRSKNEQPTKEPEPSGGTDDREPDVSFPRSSAPDSAKGAHRGADRAYHDRSNPPWHRCGEGWKQRLRL